jgi:hypothetical protein
MREAGSVKERRAVTSGVYWMSKIDLALMAPLVLIAVSAVGCTTNECDPSSTTLGVDGGIGSWDVDCSSVDGICTLSWESSPFVGNWPQFHAMQTYTFVFPPLPPLPANASSPDFSNVSVIPSVALDPPLGFGDGGIAEGNVEALAPGTDVVWLGLQQPTLDGAPDGGPTPGSLTLTNPSCAGSGSTANGSARFIRVQVLGVEVALDAGSEAAALDATPEQ